MWRGRRGDPAPGVGAAAFPVGGDWGTVRAGLFGRGRTVVGVPAHWRGGLAGQVVVGDEQNARRAGEDSRARLEVVRGEQAPDVRRQPGVRVARRRSAVEVAAATRTMARNASASKPTTPLPTATKLLNRSPERNGGRAAVHAVRITSSEAVALKYRMPSGRSLDAASAKNSLDSRWLVLIRQCHVELTTMVSKRSSWAWLSQRRPSSRTIETLGFASRLRTTG